MVLSDNPEGLSGGRGGQVGGGSRRRGHVNI